MVEGAARGETKRPALLMAPRKIITLVEGDAALVMKANGTSELIRHPYDPDEVVPLHVLVISAVALRIAEDPDFSIAQIEWLKRKQAAEGRGSKLS